MTFRNFVLALLFAATLAPVSHAQTVGPPPIEDNSFLIEEAYNQDKGVVQHIFTYRSHRHTSDYEASFTQEWPVGGITHQLSYDISLLRSNNSSGVGDFDINYRYQLVGTGETKLAIAPRFSVSLPTGDWKKGRGSGAVGAELMLPLSYVVSPLLTTHWNASVDATPSSRNSSGARADAYGFLLGQSFIVTANPNVQLLVETVYSREQNVIGNNETEWTDDLVISPGLRGAFNFSSGLQIVPGIAVPIGVGPSRGDRGIFLYLSFEHPFGKTED